MSKMNKKLPALFLALVLVLGMTACGGKATDGTTGSTDNTVTAEEEDHKTQNTKVDPNSPITEEMLRNHAVAPAEDFTYDVEDDGIKIRSYTGSDTVVVIPEEIEGKPVTGFYDYVFANDNPVRAGLIPESVKELEQVFTNNESVELVICEGVTIFRGLTFGDCSNLRQVILGENVQELVGIGTFTNCCRLMELHFTDALTSIDDEENFYGCDNLTIYGPADSYIESFAKEYGIPFVVE